MNAKTEEQQDETAESVLKAYFGDVTPVEDKASNWESPVGRYEISDTSMQPREALVSLLISADDSSMGEEAANKFADFYFPADASDKKSYAWEDASIGGGPVINPMFAFNEDDDPILPAQQIDTGDDSIAGMGSSYYEMYYRTQKIIWMTFGFSKFNSLRLFFNTAVSPRSLALFDTSNASFGQKVGTILGTTIASAITLPITSFKALNFMFDKVTNVDGSWGRVNKYYGMRPAMHRFYQLANSMLASWTVHLGFSVVTDERRAFIEKNTRASDEELGELVSDADATNLSANIEVPEILKHGPDVLAILNRRFDYRRKANYPVSAGDKQTIKSAAELDELLYIDDSEVEIISSEAMAEYVRTTTKAILGLDAEGMLDGGAKLMDSAAMTAKQAEYDAEYEALNKKEKRKAGGPTVAELQQSTVGANIDSIANSMGRAKAKFSETIDRSIGLALGDLSYIGLRLENPSAVTETISSSSGDTPMASKLKSMASSSQNRLFSIGGGSTGIDALDGIISTITALSDTVGQSLGISSLTKTITQGSGYLDIPEVWQDSSTNKDYSFSVTLHSPYRSKIALYQNILVPLSLIVPMGFPIGTGPNSYSAPMLCRAISPGIVAIPLGMVTNMAIKRGGSEFGWTHDNMAVSITVDIDIKDLSSMLFMSIMDTSLLEVFRSNSTFQNYIAMIAGVDVSLNANMHNKFKTKMAIIRSNFKNIVLNPYTGASKIGQSAMLRRVMAWHPDYQTNK